MTGKGAVRLEGSRKVWEGWCVPEQTVQSVEVSTRVSTGFYWTPNVIRTAAAAGFHGSAAKRERERKTPLAFRRADPHAPPHKELCSEGASARWNKHARQHRSAGSAICVRGLMLHVVRFAKYIAARCALHRSVTRDIHRHRLLSV